MVRRNKDRDERLKALLAEAATLSAETKRLEQQRAQLEAELAEAHRERCCTVISRLAYCWPLAAWRFRGDATVGCVECLEPHLRSDFMCHAERVIWSCCRKERSAAAGSASAAIASPARAQRKSLSPRNWQPTGSQGFGQAPGKQKPSSQTRRQHSGTAASSAPAKQPVAQGQPQESSVKALFKLHFDCLCSLRDGVLCFAQEASSARLICCRVT